MGKFSNKNNKNTRHKIPPFRLGVQRLIDYMSSIVPRMEWMSSQVLDKLEVNGFISDPLAHLPPSIRETLLKLPEIAWVTIALFLADMLVMLTIVVLAEFGWITGITAGLLLTCAMFVMFTVAHDAAHGSISSIPWVNGLIGRIASGAIGPVVCFPVARYIHHMHHKFTNHPIKDPDHFCVNGSWYTIPIRCMLVLPNYLVFYLSNITTRPFIEIVEFVIHFGCMFGFISAGIERGYGTQLMFYWIIPSMIAQGCLAFFFDFIPHHHTTTTPIENRYHTTSILQTYWFLQPIVTLLLQYQDYHLIHHLYPTIPFYRYADKWHEKQEFLLEKQIHINSLKIENLVPILDSVAHNQ